MRGVHPRHLALRRGDGGRPVRRAAHTEAAHFSFLIATPIIAGAAVLEIPKLTALPGAGLSTVVIIAGVLAGVTAYASVAFLMRHFRRHNFDDALVPFAIYCWVAGAAGALALVLMG